MSKELVIISGKGGTGKTTLTASFAYLMKDKIIVDADADAADMYILMKPQIKRKELFKGNMPAKIDAARCIGCDECRRLCRFDAIYVNDRGEYVVNTMKCDSCALCKYACPVGAIEMVESISGEWYESETPYGIMVHARIYPGAENSGNLVTMVKHRAHVLSEELGIEYILVDGSPGIGCPVISTISGADFVVIVTEPTQSGVHDLERVKKLCDSFKVRTGVVINKYDINTDVSSRIEDFARSSGSEFLGRIPFDRCVPHAITQKRIPYEACEDVREPIKSIFERSMELL